METQDGLWVGREETVTCAYITASNTTQRSPRGYVILVLKLKCTYFWKVEYLNIKKPGWGDLNQMNA